MTLTQILQKIKSAFYTKSETDTLLGGKSDTTHNHNATYLGINAKASSASSADSVAWANVSGKPSSFTPSSHNHDDRYYTESEIDTKLGGKSNTDHTHSNYLTGITKAMVTTALGYTPPTSDTNTHYTTTLYAGAKDAKSNAVTTNGNTYLKLYDDSTVRAQLNIKGTGATTVTTDANGVITINSTDNNTTYSVATTSKNGLMSSADKTKLDGLSNYTLPTASSELGGVKTTSTVTSTSGLTACPIISGVPYYKDTNTTYSSMSAAEATTGTATTARSISAKVLNDKISSMLPTKVSDLTNDSNYVIAGDQFNYNTPYFYGPTTYYYGINMADETLRLYILERYGYHETILEARHLLDGQEVYKSYLSLVATNSQDDPTIQWNGRVNNNIIPHGSNYSLGSSTYKWSDTNTALINGVVPNILGFPNSTKYQDIDFSSFVYDFNTANTFIAPCTGNIRIICDNTNAVTDYQFNTSSGYFERERATSIKHLSRTFPVIEGDTVTIKIAGGAIINLIAYKARGL